jgi:ketosteroid isomerase-like protein
MSSSSATPTPRSREATSTLPSQTCIPRSSGLSRTPFQRRGVTLGRDAVHGYFTNSSAGRLEPTTDIELTRLSGKITAMHHLAGLLLDGAPNDRTVADVFTLRDGLIVDMQAYTDPQDASQQTRGRRCSSWLRTGHPWAR